MREPQRQPEFSQTDLMDTAGRILALNPDPTPRNRLLRTCVCACHALR